jgi:hypothetical protein
MMKYLCIIAIGPLSLSAAIAGTTIDSEMDYDHKTYAQNFSGVGVLRGLLKDNPLKVTCGSAIAIDKHWILTAAHVVVDSYPEDLIFRIDHNLYLVDKVIVHKLFDKYSDSSIADIAICRTRNPIILNKYHTLYDGQDEKDAFCSIVGSGIYGSIFSFKRIKDYKIRAGTNMVDSIFEDKLRTNFSIAFPTKLEYLISYGDSGGPLLIDDKIAGIHSFINGPFNSSTIGTHAFHTRVSIYYNWIKENMQENSYIIPEIKALKKPWYMFWK